MPKLTLLIIALVVVILTGSATLFFNNVIVKPIPKNEIEGAANQAKTLYNQKIERKEDITSGPCLSNALMPGWVADIVHNPRLPADDLPENQCPAYLEGTAEHFVEIDQNGNFVRAK